MLLREQIILRKKEFLKKLEENSLRNVRDRERRERIAYLESHNRKKLNMFEDALRRAPRELFKRPQWRVVVAEIAKKTGFTMDELLGRQRKPPALNRARHECFYRLHLEVKMSTVEIAERFGDRDHSTVIHGIQKHRKIMESEQCTTKTS
jgi:chromosomal replication initiation ATPase DnaA